MTLATKITFFSVLILGVSCKKYEENPLISLQSKKSRLIGGYNIAGYWVNGNDSTDYMNTQLLLPSNSKCNINFSIADKQQKIMGGTCYGEWDFADNKKKLLIDISDNLTYSIGPFLTRNPLKWEITKLVEGQVHLKVEYQNKNYILQLHQN